MVRYTRTTFTNPSTDSDWMRQVQDPLTDYSEQVGPLAPINIKDSYGLHGGNKLHTSRERRAQKIQQSIYDSDRPQNYHRYSDFNRLELSLPTKKKAYHLKNKRHPQYEQLKPDKSEPRFINLTGIHDFELTQNSHHQRGLRVNRVGESNVYGLVDPNRNAKSLKGVSAELRSEDDSSEFIQESDMRSQRTIDGYDPFCFQWSLDQPTMERTITMVNIDDNSSFLAGRRIQNDSAYKRMNRMFQTTNGLNNDEMRCANKEKHVFNHNNVGIIYDFPKTDDYLHAPDTSQVGLHNEPDCLRFEHTPLRLLQRPPRAKRMDIHKPELLVIPEIGATFQQPKNMDPVRNDMLLSVPLSTRNLLYVPSSKPEREKRTEVRHGTNLQHKWKLENTSLSFSNNFDLPHRKIHSKHRDAAMSRLAETSLHSFQLQDTSRELKKWNKHSLPDNGLQPYRDKEDDKLTRMTLTHDQSGYNYYN